MNLAQAIDNERKRIVELLHDRSGADLAAAAVSLRTIDNRLGALGLSASQPELHNLLDEAQNLLANVTAQLRELCTELRPAHLDYAGLVPALAAEIERYRRRTGLAIDFNAHLSMPDATSERLPADQEWLLFRVAQEALSNCARHARARALSIQLWRAPDRAVQLRISDDGIGFDPAALGTLQAPIGSGLLMMRERTESAGGRYRLSARPGGGTHIDVRLPPAPGG